MTRCFNILFLLSASNKNQRHNGMTLSGLAGLRGVDFLPLAAEKLQRSFTARHGASLSSHDEAKSAREYSWQNRSNGK
jgi:hypothetical protein